MYRRPFHRRPMMRGPLLRGPMRRRRMLRSPLLWGPRPLWGPLWMIPGMGLLFIGGGLLLALLLAVRLF